jgi:hypothetical protein
MCGFLPIVIGIVIALHCQSGRYPDSHPDSHLNQFSTIPFYLKISLSLIDKVSLFKFIATIFPSGEIRKLAGTGMIPKRRLTDFGSALFVSLA